MLADVEVAQPQLDQGVDRGQRRPIHVYLAEGTGGKFTEDVGGIVTQETFDFLVRECWKINDAERKVVESGNFLLEVARRGNLVSISVHMLDDSAAQVWVQNRSVTQLEAEMMRSGEIKTWVFDIRTLESFEQFMIYLLICEDVDIFHMSASIILSLKTDLKGYHQEQRIN